MVSGAVYHIRGVEHCYRDEPVLQVESLAIPQASIVGLVGPNGSGKSTLLNLLGFVLPPTRGEILFKGRPAAPFSVDIRFRVTLLGQEPYLLRRSVARNISYGLELRGDRDRLRARIDEALDGVGLPAAEFADRPWSELSGGEAQRVALAARLILRPEVLLLDEPTASVDAASAERIKTATLKARSEWGTTLVIASHDWQWLHEVCDVVLHLFKGRLFGRERINIVFGPWRPREGGLWYKSLADGQVVVVPPPPRPEAVAVFTGAELASVIDGGRRWSPIGGVLSGVVSRLILEREGGNVLAVVQIGQLPVTVKLPRQEVEKRQLFPGRPIAVRLRSDSVVWM